MNDQTITDTRLVPLEPLHHPGINLGHAHGDAHAKAEEVVFGFWVFLMSDLILFSLMFATYIIMADRTAGGPGPLSLYDLRSVAIQTGALLLSSFTFGMATLNMKYDRGRRIVAFWLIVTLLLGLVFIGFELLDFHDMIAVGAGPSRSGYLSGFFGLVPLHGLHVSAGIVWILVMLVQMAVFGLNDQVKTRLLRLGIFWHFLDIIWVGIFSVVYLGGLA